MKIAIGNDHAGFKLKGELIPYLEAKGFSIEDLGCYTEDSMDYPDAAHPVCKAIENNTADLGLLICGSGNGITITANKHQKIRAALCWKAEIATLARQHNDANILSLPARFITKKEALEITNAFFDAQFEGGRHQKRVNKIPIQ